MRTKNPTEHAEWLLEQNRLKDRTDLCSLLEQFPDLILVENPSGQWVPCTVEANPHVDSVDFRFSDRKSDSAPLVAWPYIVMEEGRLFSFPPCIPVAVPVCLGFGENPFLDWKNTLSQYNIGLEVEDIVQRYLDKHPPHFL